METNIAKEYARLDTASTPGYFSSTIPMEYVDMYDIRYQVTYYKDKEDMYLEAQKINFNNPSQNIHNRIRINIYFVSRFNN